ncbi:MULTISPECIES: TVP38/TMEM64 family protein [unclassified Streptomyces]|uniref:TVP38/TMEM64 family protein n=1 Tax=unclassified Streptomyces TaxID=2593676 RepID=UPI003369F933
MPVGYAPSVLDVAAPPAPAPAAPAARRARALFSPRLRLCLLVALLAGAAGGVWAWQPHRLLAQGWPPQLSGATAVVVFVAAYGGCAAALVPRPLLNLAAGALFGSSMGLAAAVAGTVLAAGVSFGLGRLLGQDALRPLLRARWLAAADRQLSRHGFRSMLAIRLFPGVPFAAANYCAAVSRMGWLPFLLATGLGSVPNTAAYAVAGSHATTPTSPVFLAALACVALPALVGFVVAWRRRGRLGGTARKTGRCAPPVAGRPGS